MDISRLKEIVLENFWRRSSARAWISIAYRDCESTRSLLDHPSYKEWASLSRARGEQEASFMTHYDEMSLRLKLKDFVTILSPIVNHTFDTHDPDSPRSPPQGPVLLFDELAASDDTDDSSQIEVLTIETSDLADRLQSSLEDKAESQSELRHS